MGIAAGTPAPKSPSSPIQDYVEGLLERFRELDSGEVASYIPELAKADRRDFGICVATTDGRVYEAGDSRKQFTIQSISKPFVYGLAMEDRGREAVLQKIGVEPTGEAFNEISLVPETGCPRNPMINAGAIVAASLVAGHSEEDRLNRILTLFSLYAGRPLSLDEAVYASEKETGHRNRAIGHMLRNFDILTDDPTPALDLYFRQCSISVDCRDLSLMAATLANSGVNPVTGESAIRFDLAESVLSVMSTCGMYDYAGEWAYRVGLPAKSGVGGGIVAVLPGQLGIGVYSPPLDIRGNSVRGIAVCRAMSSDFNLHALRASRRSRSTIRGEFTLAEFGSRRLRPPAERAILDRLGRLTRVFDLFGDLDFAAIEAVLHRIVGEDAEVRFAVIDLRRVTRIDEAAARLLLDLLLNVGRGGAEICFVGLGAHARTARYLDEELAARHQGRAYQTFPDADAAIEWCENRIVADAMPGLRQEPVDLADQPLLAGMSPDQLATMAALADVRRFDRHQYIVRRGEAADAFYLLRTGRVSVVLPRLDGRLERLATLPAGTSFGELALLDRSPRTADVCADEHCECYVISVEAFATLEAEQPTLRMRLLENMLGNAARVVGRLSREVAFLAR